MIFSILLKPAFNYWYPRSAVSLLCVFLVMHAIVANPSSKSRIIVTIDITNEPDDQEFLIRFLAYSNNFDIEGLIGSTGIWKLCEPATNVIHECIDSYAKVRTNLVLHDSSYPSSEYLHSITATGNTGYGSAVGFRSSKVANMIIGAVDKDDPRPVWCLVWGGANTVAQALWTVKHTGSKEELNKFVGN